MHFCKSCGQPLLNKDRGNIQPSYPNGFSHIECPELVEIIKKVVVKELIVSDDECLPEEISDVEDEYSAK